MRFNTLSYILVLALIVSCNGQKSSAESTSASKTLDFKFVSATSQKINPGVYDDKNAYVQQFVITLKGEAQQQGQAVFMINNYNIPLKDFGNKGVQIGADIESYIFEFKIRFPLEKNYPENRVEGKEGIFLKLMTKAGEQEIAIDPVEKLMPVFYPTVDD